MLETPLIYRFILNLPALSLFKTMCLNILLTQRHSLPQISTKSKKLSKSFSSTYHKIVLILFLYFEPSLSSRIHTAKSFNTNVILSVYDMKLIFFVVLLRKPQRRDQDYSLSRGICLKSASSRFCILQHSFV